MISQQELVDRLRRAAGDQGIALYLGTGVSVKSGIPTWEGLVARMYYAALVEANHGFYRNYQLAMARWHLEQVHEPLDIVARKIRAHYDASREDFVECMRTALYADFIGSPEDPIADTDELENNRTLRAVVDLISDSKRGSDYIKSVVTYNYDDLLEEELDPTMGQPDYSGPYEIVFRQTPRHLEHALPIYHVHGFGPRRHGSEGSAREEIIFTEEQYNQIASDSWSWANIVQLRYMSSTVGLFIGLSLTDKNIRRLLDMLRRSPINIQHYALLPKPTEQQLSGDDIQRIDEIAREYHSKFSQARIKTADRLGTDLQRLMSNLSEFDTNVEEQILRELGITPYWLESFDEIHDILRQMHR
jgi:hypothetical protein